MNQEDQKKIEIAAEASFLAALGALAAIELAPGAPIMPRHIWAQGMAAALFEAGAIPADRLEIAGIVLASDLGNSSQLGAKLLKEGKLKRQASAAAGESFLAKLAARAASQEAAPAA